MRNIFLFLLAGIFFACNTTERSIERYFETEGVRTVAKSAPFSRGFNFSAWFEADSAQNIDFSRYSEQDFIDAKSLGADVIRLPVRLHSMTSGEPDFIIDPLLFRLLDKAIDWAEKHELYIIIDNHSFHPIFPTPNDVYRVLLPVWEQIARRYRDRSHFVIYEILNEPHGIADALWGEIQGRAIDTIRKIDPYRLIIVGGTDFNSIEKLFALPWYDDPNLIYTFHFYDPHVFTHQGAGWGTPSLADLRGVPFPANFGRMPRLPASLRGTWVEGAFFDYMNAGRPARIYRALDRAVEFSIQRNVPIFCGEFGVFIPNSFQEDRVRWYRIVTAALNRRGIAWTAWDYYGGFGIFNDMGRGCFNSDLNVEVVRALGFTPPIQVPRTIKPLTEAFILYDDFTNRKLTVGFWGANTDFSLFDENAASGEFSIRWGNAARYNIFYFNFYRNSDFSKLAAAGYFLEFQARTESSVHFDVRFVSLETADSFPWRMRYTIDNAILPPDGNWHTIRIPLVKMSEHGAWIDVEQRWLEPRGEFSWENAQRLEFVAEYENMSGQYIWFDNILIGN